MKYCIILNYGVLNMYSWFIYWYMLIKWRSYFYFDIYCILKSIIFGKKIINCKCR